MPSSHRVPKSAHSGVRRGWGNAGGCFGRWLSGRGVTGHLVCGVASFCLFTDDSLKHFDLFIFFFFSLRSYILHCLISGLSAAKKKKKKSKLCWIPFHIICLFNLLSWSSYFLFSLSFCTVTLFDRWLCEILGIPPCFFSEASPFWKWFSSVIWIFCPFQLCPEF